VSIQYYVFKYSYVKQKGRPFYVHIQLLLCHHPWEAANKSQTPLPKGAYVLKES